MPVEAVDPTKLRKALSKPLPDTFGTLGSGGLGSGRVACSDFIKPGFGGFVKPLELGIMTDVLSKGGRAELSVVIVEFENLFGEKVDIGITSCFFD